MRHFSLEAGILPAGLPNSLREFATSPEVLKAQRQVIGSRRKRGAEVILSCHTDCVLTAVQVRVLAHQMEKRGAGLIKIVTTNGHKHQKAPGDLRYRQPLFRRSALL